MPSVNWLGKESVLNHHLEVPFRTLRRVSGFGDAEIARRNKIIHGDNLLALKALLPEFEGRVHCIHIDPLYNTGSEAWTYNDDSAQKLKLGQAWEKKAGHSFKYFMVFQNIHVEGAFAKNQFASTAGRL